MTIVLKFSQLFNSFNKNKFKQAPTSIITQRFVFGDSSNLRKDLSWEGVTKAIDEGTYKNVYDIGDCIPIDFGNEGVINMQIAAFDTDTLADGSGTAAITWVAKELLGTSHRMNPAREGTSGAYTDGTGCIGGWEKCEMRTYLQDTIKPMLPATVTNMIRSVIKYSNAIDTTGSEYQQTTHDEIWIPNTREVNFKKSWTEQNGPVYSELFTDDTSRQKAPAAGSTNYTRCWWLRSHIDTTDFRGVERGAITNQKAERVTPIIGHICVCFCTGKTQS